MWRARSNSTAVSVSSRSSAATIATRASSALTVTRPSRSSEQSSRCPSGRRSRCTSSAKNWPPRYAELEAKGYAFLHGPVDQRWLWRGGAARRSRRPGDLPLSCMREPDRPALAPVGIELMERGDWDPQVAGRAAGASRESRPTACRRAAKLGSRAGARPRLWRRPQLPCGLPSTAGRGTGVDFSEVALRNEGELARGRAVEARLDPRRRAGMVATSRGLRSSPCSLPAAPRRRAGGGAGPGGRGGRRRKLSRGRSRSPTSPRVGWYLEPGRPVHAGGRRSRASRPRRRPCRAGYPECRGRAGPARGDRRPREGGAARCLRVTVCIARPTPEGARRRRRRCRVTNPRAAASDRSQTSTAAGSSESRRSARTSF